MPVGYYDQLIAQFHAIRPGLAPQELAVLLAADQLYKHEPEDVSEFRKIYAHFDPTILHRPHQGITFTRIASEGGGADLERKKLNDYMNIKFNDARHYRNYRANAALFERNARIASEILEDILARSSLPAPILEVLKEREAVRTCHDFYDMLQLYRRSRDARIRYEILRKIGLVVLIARINRSVEIMEMDGKRKEVSQAFHRGLRGTPQGERHIFFWLTETDEIAFETDPRKARTSYRKALQGRLRTGRPLLPIQRFRCRPFLTFSGIPVLRLEIRDKFRYQGRLSYTSCVEKMVRKNLEFPNQVHDIIGVKIVVEKESQVSRMIRDLESFLGGSSTRKKEKNTYHRFGKQRLRDGSPPQYVVWKAIYDIPLSHPSIAPLREILNRIQGNRSVCMEIRKRLRSLAGRPRDFVIEVQIQDLQSYLLGIARGSPIEHARLKTDQIRSNSLYKFFPREIYGKEIEQLERRLLCGSPLSPRPH